MTIFTTTLRRILKQPINWVFILLFPVIFTVLLSSADEYDMAVTGDTMDGMSFGVVDQDGTALSKTLVRALEIRYNVRVFVEEDISAALTDSEVPWVLLIREGFAADILEGRAPALEGYSLTLSDVSALGSASAQNITRALLLLGTDDHEKLAAWEDLSRVDASVLRGDNWGYAAQWLGFYGFVSIFTAYFIIKTLTDDKRGGMPDRLGVSPHSPRKVLIQSTLAGFILTEVTALLLLFVLRWQLGAVPHAVHLFLIMSMYNLFCVGLVQTLVFTLRDLGAASVVMTMVSTVSAMLGGLFWPLDFVPEFMAKLAWFSPGYWLARGLAEIRIITFEGFGMPILFLAGFTAVVFLLGGRSKVQGA